LRKTRRFIGIAYDAAERLLETDPLNCTHISAGSEFGKSWDDGE
jgi:hypothetical protein